MVGPYGVFANSNLLPARAALDYGRRAEELGFDALWFNGVSGRQAFAFMGALSVETSRIELGIAIACTYAFHAQASHAGANTLHELSGGRFRLVLGLSHPNTVAEIWQRESGPPLSTMERYVSEYRNATYRAPQPHGEPPLLLAALGPRMLALAGRETEGAMPYLVPAGYVPGARRVLDEAAAAAGRSRPFLAVTMAVRVDEDAARARETARAYLRPYFTQPDYLRNLAACGFSSDELQMPGSDRFVDSVVAWGEAAGIKARLRELLDHGADHVAIVPLRADGTKPDIEALERLAPPW